MRTEFAACHKCITVNALNSLESQTHSCKRWLLSLGWESKRNNASLFQSVFWMYHNKHIHFPWGVERTPPVVCVLHMHTNKRLLKTKRVYDMYSGAFFILTGTLRVMSGTAIYQRFIAMCLNVHQISVTLMDWCFGKPQDAVLSSTLEALIWE